MQKWPKEMGMQDDKTYFIEKINLGLLKSNQSKAIDYVESLEDYRSKFGSNWDVRSYLKPKIHTIRKDESERWKPGMKIHFVVNNRSPNRFQFAPVVQCVSVQEFKIEWISGVAWVTIGHRSFTTFRKTDHGYEYGENSKELALNDGFATVEDFFKYFNKDFKGSLIHWTNLSY
ncbi:hypothetical protein [Sphingobacterium sp. UBA6320]|uniref:hypothetical protein n=1 Tax=Sphingobacterium sp. UBA6320 TaxID=1947510 RepID=UPI0025E8BD15|nr:hypothetical protein [Sphingobacterium sp. UBA6320]